MSDLARRKQELDEKVRRISQELKRLRKQGRRAGGLEVTANQRSTARVLMAMRDGEPTAAMAFLKSKHKGEPTAATAWVEVEADLQAWWVSADEATKNAHTLLDETNRRLHTAIQQAQRFIVDEELESWVADQNVGKGINPVPGVTLQEAGRLKRRLGVDVARTRRGDRQWMQRWRRRMGLRLRKFPAIEPLEKNNMQDKASAGTGQNKTNLVYFFQRQGRAASDQKNVRFWVAVLRPPVVGYVEEVVRKRPFFCRVVFFCAFSTAVRRKHCGAGVISCRAWIHPSENEFSLTWTKPVCDWFQMRVQGM